MERVSPTEFETPMTTHEAAFYDTLQSQVDSFISYMDLAERHPDVDWTNQIASTWSSLVKRPELEDRLLPAGDGKSRIYMLLSRPNDVSILLDRLQYMEGQYGESVADEKIVKMWKKRTAAVGAIAVAISSGVALGTYLHYKRKR